jgi:hypothetical protein
MPTSSGPNTLGESNLVFAYDTGDVKNSYRGEPTTNLLPNGVAAVHDAASGNAVTVTDATSEKGPGWKKVTITARGSNFRTLQWTYLEMSANTTYTFSAVFDWGNMRGKNYFTYFDGSGTGTRTYYYPGDYTTPITSNVDSSMPDGKFAGKILHSGTHTHSFFIGNYTTGVSGLNDYFYYKEFQVEVNSHPTPFTTGTRSATQGLLPLIGNSTIDLSNVSFNSNAQMVFDGTNDGIDIVNTLFTGTENNVTLECVVKLTANQTSKVFISNYTEASSPTGLGVGISDSTTNKVKWFTGNLGTTNTLTSNTTLLNGTYYHVVGTYNGSSKVLYINGISEASTTLTNAINITSVVASIGYLRYLNNQYLNGEIPVAKIYNRALTAQEVRQNYQQYKTRFNLS